MADELEPVMPIEAFNEYLEKWHEGKEFPLKLRNVLEHAYLAGMMKAIGEYMDEEIAQAKADEGTCPAMKALDVIEARWRKQGHI